MAATLKILYALFRKHKGKWWKGEETFPPRKALMIYLSGTLLQMLKDIFSCLFNNFWPLLVTPIFPRNMVSFAFLTTLSFIFIKEVCGYYKTLISFGGRDSFKSKAADVWMPVVRPDLWLWPSLTLDECLCTHMNKWWMRVTELRYAAWMQPWRQCEDQKKHLVPCLSKSLFFLFLCPRTSDLV